MTQPLRDELARLADRSVEVPVPAGEVWARGRRARRTDRLVTAAALVLVVALLGSVTALFMTSPTRVAPATPVEGRPAVPATLFPVPTHVQDDPSAYTSDLAVGTQAVAFVTAHGAPVVVSATDGSYRLLELEGWSGPEGQTLAISPDGQQLAFALSHGARVVDLATGEHRDVEFPKDWFGDVSWRVTTVAWSSDGREVFYGAVVGDSSEVDTFRTLDLDSDAVTPPRPLTGAVPVVGPSGALWSVSASTIRSIGREPQDLQQLSIDPPLAPTGVGQASPDLDVLAIANVETSGVDLFTGEDGAGLTEGSDAPGLPLGWLDDDVLVVQQDRSPVTGIALRDTTSPDSPDRVVTRVVQADSAGLPRDVSLAVDLLGETEVAERPAPDWPMDPDRRALLLALTGLAGVLALAAGGLVWARRNRY